jgi:dTMP kinase
LNPQKVVSSGIGRFVTFEGLDGCGKTTQLAMLAKKLRLESPDWHVLETLNPGGTLLGKELRQIILCQRQESSPPSAMAELFLYLADRAQHVHEVISPALQSKTVVLCDRFTDSTIAYQGYGRGLSNTMLAQLNTWASQAIVPDCTFLLDAPVELLLGRLKGPKDRLESESVSFFERVRQGYLDLARQYPERIVLLDASQSVEVLSELVFSHLTTLLTPSQGIYASL